MAERFDRARAWRGRRPARPALVLMLVLTLALASSLAASGCGAAGGTGPRPTPTATVAAGTPRPAVPFLRVPQGFRTTQYYGGLKTSRFIAFGPDGALFVAERGANQIIALADPGHTGAATRRTVVASGLGDPTSVAFHDGALYVGERSRVSRLTLGPDLRATGTTVIVPNLPTSGQHTTRTVLIGQDGRLYTAIGSTCNVCVESDPRRAAVWVYNLDGGGGRLYAKGLRNAVGLATNPWNGQTWATNNGRDYLGDDSPPETVNALRDGADFGWPRCHAGTIVDPDFGKAGACDGVAAPAVKMQAHSAPLGLAFYTSGAFPARYHGLFVNDYRLKAGACPHLAAGLRGGLTAPRPAETGHSDCGCSSPR